MTKSKASMPPHNVAVILSGGVGSRFASKTPKQYVKLAGRMMIEHTIDVFERSPHIDEIVVVAAAEFTEMLWASVASNGWKKVTKIALAGTERFDSTASALTALGRHAPDSRVILHDAVRPLVSQRILRDCVEALHQFQACDVVVPSADTIVQIDDTGCISAIPQRSSLRRGQTPQAFVLSTLREAYDKALTTRRKNFTCDCGVVRAMLPSVRVVTVDGDETNMKITNPGDLFLAEKFFQSRTTERLATEGPASQHLTRALAGKVVAIIGGTDGIGKAIAERCLLSQGIPEVCGRSTGVDVSSYSDVESFLAQVAQKRGRIDHVINTAGKLSFKPLEAMTQEEVVESINVNYLGAVNTARAALKHLKQTRGTLVLFTSSSYTRGRPYYSLYSSSKAAVVNLTQALGDEWAEFGVRVLCINPERTNTRMRRETFGTEPPGSLLEAGYVAGETLLAILSVSGGVVDVRNTQVAATVGGAT